MASTGQVFKQRMQLKQSAPIILLSTNPRAASLGQALMQAPQRVHKSRLIFTLKILSFSSSQEINPKGHIN